MEFREASNNSAFLKRLANQVRFLALINGCLITACLLFMQERQYNDSLSTLHTYQQKNTRLQFENEKQRLIQHLDQAVLHAKHLPEESLLNILPELIQNAHLSGAALLDSDLLFQQRFGETPDSPSLAGKLEGLSVKELPLNSTNDQPRYYSWCDQQSCYLGRIFQQSHPTANNVILLAAPFALPPDSVDNPKTQALLFQSLTPNTSPSLPNWQLNVGPHTGILNQDLLVTLSQQVSLESGMRSGIIFKLNDLRLQLSIGNLPLTPQLNTYWLDLTDITGLVNNHKKERLYTAVFGLALSILSALMASMFFGKYNRFLQFYTRALQQLSLQRPDKAKALLAKLSVSLNTPIAMRSLAAQAIQTAEDFMALRHTVKLHNREVERLALQDPLTGLANRNLFQYELEHEVVQLTAESKPLAIILIDLDNFKRINDSLDHQQGDILLTTLAKRLKKLLPSNAIIARFGGDEFAIILPQLSSLQKTEELCQDLIDTLNEPVSIQNKSVVTSGSAGIVIIHEHNNIDELIKYAELAMYNAKQRGGNCYQVFEQNMATTANDNFYLEEEIRRAFKEKEFTLYLQPKVDMKRHIRGFEALIRWDHPSKGVLGPVEFIPFMESMGLITELDIFVLEASCRQLHVLEKLFPDISISVNISGNLFAKPVFISILENILIRYPINPKRLELEITETLLMDDLAAAQESIKHIKALGIHIAIDDFGTGYSSLSYLKNLPVNTLKIDREFIKDIPHSNCDMQISSAIIFLAKQLNFNVVAEGVETEAQLDFLIKSQCDLAQGFLFSKPIPAHQAILLLESERD